MIQWGKERAPLVDTINKWITRAGVLVIFLLAASFVKFVADWLHIRGTLPL